MTKEKRLTEADLRQFTGSEHWHRHGVVEWVLYTDGAKYVADTADAYWLLDEIVYAQGVKCVFAEEFQVWRLVVNANSSATLTCEDGNGNTVVWKAVPYTDFPLPGITLWVANNTIYLPSEH